MWMKTAGAFLCSVGRTLAPFTEALIRIYAGLALVSHGYPKLFGATAANVAFFETAGFRPSLLWTILVGLTEVGGGLCLALGLFTRAVAVPILIFLLTAVVYHSRFGFYWNARGFEYPLFCAIVDQDRLCGSHKHESKFRRQRRSRREKNLVRGDRARPVCLHGRGRSEFRRDRGRRRR